MKNHFPLLFTILLSMFSYAQENDSINILFNSEWKVFNYNLQKEDTLELFRRFKYNFEEDQFIKDKLINSNTLNPEQIKRLKKYNSKIEYGAFLVFDSISNVKYELRVPCRVGISYYEFLNLKLIKNKVYFHFNLKTWNEPDSKKEYKYFYNIIKWNENNIVLKKTNRIK